MRAAGIQGLYRRRRHGCAIRNPADPLAADLVNRQFTVDEPDRLWLTDITEHPTLEGEGVLRGGDGRLLASDRRLVDRRPVPCHNSTLVRGPAILSVQRACDALRSCCSD
jgi:transposase InsO family protein